MLRDATSTSSIGDMPTTIGNATTIGESVGVIGDPTTIDRARDGGAPPRRDDDTRPYTTPSDATAFAPSRPTPIKPLAPARPTPSEQTAFAPARPTPSEQTAFAPGRPTPSEPTAFAPGRPTPSDRTEFAPSPATPSDTKSYPIAPPTPNETKFYGAPPPTPDDLKPYAPPPTKTDVRTSEFALEPGTMLGDYKIEGKIAEGGWGTVFSAVHPLIGKRTAIKVLQQDLCRRPAAVQRFIDEARAVNQIGHPNIVDVYTFGETLDGRSYFVMEWLKGETLLARLRRGPLTYNELRTIVKPLARALEAAHAKGIVHRDLKPDNVFLVEVPGEYPQVKLLDFGIAKLATEERFGMTSTGEIVGTPIYMAPEQARGRQIDHRADIYALGGILFEVLTGRTPYAADNAADMIALHLTAPPPRPSGLVPNVVPELDNLVVAMLSKDAAARPTLADVCTALDRIRGEQAGGRVATRPTLGEPQKKWTLPSQRVGRAATQFVRDNDRKWLLVGGTLVAIIFALLIVRALDRHRDPIVRALVPAAAR